MPHIAGSLLADLSGEMCAEAIYPKTDTFVANIYPTFMEQVLDVPQRKRESDIHHHGELDDFRRCFEIAKRVLGHERG